MTVKKKNRKPLSKVGLMYIIAVAVTIVMLAIVILSTGPINNFLKTQLFPILYLPRPSAWPLNHRWDVSMTWEGMTWHSTRVSLSWPPNHYGASTWSWPPEHKSAQSMSWPYWPGPSPYMHSRTMSDLWFTEPNPHNISLSPLWPPDHQQIQSLLFPPNHNSAISLSWVKFPDPGTGSSHVKVVSSIWPPNHSAQESWTWPDAPKHSVSRSQNWPPDHNVYDSLEFSAYYTPKVTPPILSPAF
ncbi:MAG: hypothetical protein A3E37_01440 [Candidatus Andersenbacteria bacterium RIFCSPHIGHO2_12_FULL_46_9]|nr:MAG: hypothetical protein A3B76_04535 [Candidatus Andersenbacteria bacterium RIFCSPHIGHO2_02_FULL_46_16]OGY38259.1 MAG: hypothetical protein A3E37_01440 [Candidatus Andersenbacteria bacterium RIFCSPHIGHO2_12_FULL_46_9]HBE90428.1 hypothetical protein [Candidatus Andersenbacteria bacterium]